LDSLAALNHFVYCGSLFLFCFVMFGVKVC